MGYKHINEKYGKILSEIFFFKKRTRISGLLVSILQNVNLDVNSRLHYHVGYTTTNLKRP